MSKYSSRQPYKSQSGCDLWDVNCSPRVTNVKSQRNPNAAPGSQLKSWLTDLSPVVYLMLMCDAYPSGLQGNFRALLWGCLRPLFSSTKRVIPTFFPLVLPNVVIWYSLNKVPWDTHLSIILRKKQGVCGQWTRIPMSAPNQVFSPSTCHLTALPALSLKWES